MFINIIHMKMILQQNSFYPATNAPKILIVWHLRKIAPRLEALPLVTSGTRADSATVSSVMWTFCAVVMASKDPKMSRQVGNNTQFQRFLKNWK
jgi:hypothetical protein